MAALALSVVCCALSCDMASALGLGSLASGTMRCFDPAESSAALGSAPGNQPKAARAMMYDWLSNTFPFGDSSSSVVQSTNGGD